MKTSYFSLKILFTVLFISVSVKAQIPNSGFEDWNNTEPAGWISNNVEEFSFVTKSSNAFSGSFSARVEAKSISNILVPCVLAAGENGDGFPISQRYGQLSLYYKFNQTINTAVLTITVGVQKGEDAIGAGVVSIIAGVSDYTPVTIPITYITNDVPDFAVIIIQVGDQQMNPAANGSFAEIDNLSFEAITDVKDDNSSVHDFRLEQNYPNPFNPATVINYKLSESDFVSLKVYDIIGNEVATLINKQQPAGSYSVNFDATNLPSGIYVYRLQAGSKIQTKKMTLLK